MYLYRMGEDQKLINDLRSAMKAEELYLVYQPILNSNEEMVAIEALLRWKHPRYHFISPEQIIKMAEENDLIFELGKWILQEACHFTKTIQEDYPTMSLHINISPAQLTDGQFISTIKKVLTETKLHPSCLQIEITENLNVFDIEDSIKKLHQLKDLGLSIAVDDFGTGYSSLQYLHQLPVDRLKIDKSFVMNLNPEDGKAKAILSTIISLAGTLNMDVVAEGVETELQYTFLKEKGCHLFQGYYFYKPLQTNQIRQIIENEQIATH
ncbi:putative bifunctional diguanylate cyclase/phosphodiesterase [Salinibacillus xinjiangensis]|uniref:EAL domain-containing protein n=1 Tax=Salinibacillus xinjiangensis TaxID=1229268 RepID=A0A6G1X4F9_9BACI|nr:EAL domain-containing protein [Salinibacillus xinjiangensis]MRG85718.1 EAL domain-containing protein [Salinibacillus xinjiangensis]